MEAADVLFFDCVIRSGAAAGFVPLRPPYVPGNGVAGRVISVGEGADRRWAGRRAVAHTGGHGGSGGYAERAAVAAGALVPVPDGIGLRQAAALLHDGATALGLVVAPASARATGCWCWARRADWASCCFGSPAPRAHGSSAVGPPE